MIGSSTTTTHGLLVPLCGHEISGWLRGWNNLLTGAAAAGEAAGKWVFSPPSRASLLSTAIGSAAPASSSCSSLLRHYYPILRLRPWRAADICRRFIIPSKATTRCCRRSSSFDRLSNNIIPPEMKRVPKKLWDDRLSRALSSVARCGCIVCAAIILLCSVVNNNNNNTRNSRVSELWLLLSWRSLLSCTTQSRAFGSVDWYVNINSFEKLWGNETITIELHPSPINRRRKLYTFIPDPSTGRGSCHLHPILTLMYS